MAATTKVVPGIPLAALDAISDQNTRDVLRALVDGHHLRNGQSGDGDERFITAKEMGLGKGQGGRGGGASSGGGATPGGSSQFQDIGRIVAELQAQVLESPLFKDLGRRIALLDAPLGKVEQTRQDLLEAANKALAEFDKENADLGNGVTNLTALFDSSIKQTRAIKKTLYDATGTLPLASAAILDINNVSLTSKSANARTLAGVNATVFDPSTGLAASRADYVRLITAEANLRSAVASLVDALSAQVNDPNTGLAASRADYINRITLEANARGTVASQLSGLTAKIIDPATGRTYAEGMIADDRQISLTNATALAQQSQSVYASLGAKNRTYWSATPPPYTPAKPGSPYTPAQPGIPAKPAVLPQEASPVAGDIWYDTAHYNIPKRHNGTSWDDVSDVRAVEAAGLVYAESRVRVAQDNVLVQAITTIWGALGGNSGLIQAGDTITVNTAGAVAESFKQVQAAVKDGNGNLISSAAIRQTTEALADRSGKVDLKWMVELDAGGAAMGFRQAGFGIAGSASPNGPVYDFGVRADRFWIASPGESYANAPTARVPFIVKTSSWTDSQGVAQPPGVYLNELFATSAKIGNAQIRTAMIGDAQIDTLRLAGNAVTVPFVGTNYGQFGGQGRNVFFVVANGAIWLDSPGMVFASSSGYIAYGQGWVAAGSRLLINGQIVSDGGGEEAWDNACHSGGLYCPAGMVVVQLQFMGLDSRVRIMNPTIFIQGAKR